jgi:hypothetical protein
MFNSVHILLVFFIIISVTSGCVSSPSNPITSVKSTLGITATVDQTGRVVEYRRTGGLAGFDDHLIVQGDGSVFLSRRGVISEFNLETNTLAQLRRLLDEIDLVAVAQDNNRPAKGADLFQYVIIIDGHEIHAIDTKIPQALQPVLAILDQIIARGDKTQ